MAVSLFSFFWGRLTKAHITVMGWHYKLALQKPSNETDYDQVVDRLICPRFVQYNFSLKRFDKLLFSSLEEYPSTQQKKSCIWKLKIRRGLFWWDGTKLELSHVVDFLEKNLSSLIREKNENLWLVPQHKITIESGSILIHWSKKPTFGPFVLNSSSLWKKLSSKDLGKFPGYSYQCVGAYYPRQKDQALALIPTPGYNYARSRPTVSFKTENDEVKLKAKAKFVRFKMASDFSLPLTKYNVKNNHSLVKSIPLSYVTAILWNQNQKIFKGKGLKKTLNSLVPSQLLISSGAYHLGEPCSFFIPHNFFQFPSFSFQKTVDFTAVNNKLTSLGYKRKDLESKRFKPGNEILHLRLGSQVANHVVTKVLVDNFEASGIGVSIKVLDSPTQWEDLDLFVGGLKLSFSDLSSLSSFHSKSDSLINELGFQTSQNLDQDIERYNKDLSLGVVNEKVLQKISSYLEGHSNVSVVMRHSSLVEIGGVRNKDLTFLNIKDPGWFRQLILKLEARN